MKVLLIKITNVSDVLFIICKNKIRCPFEITPKGHEEAVWCIPDRVCTVEYMPNTKDALRQPVFKGIREDVVV